MLCIQCYYELAFYTLCDYDLYCEPYAMITYAVITYVLFDLRFDALCYHNVCCYIH